MVSVPMAGASPILLAAGEDVKPMDLEPSESAFTRRSGGSFAPRGGLLQGVPHGPGANTSDPVAQQMHHLMVSSGSIHSFIQRFPYGINIEWEHRVLTIWE